MGVMPCSRECCDEIMCRRYMDGLGYICDDCFAELVEYRATWPERMSVAEIGQRISDFMRTVPGAHRLIDAAGVEAEFKRLTRS